MTGIELSETLVVQIRMDLCSNRPHDYEREKGCSSHLSQNDPTKVTGLTYLPCARCGILKPCVKVIRKIR